MDGLIMSALAMVFKSWVGWWVHIETRINTGNQRHYLQCPTYKILVQRRSYPKARH